MASLEPRPPYTRDELTTLYPAELQLQQVQILLRHGERTPVSARFQTAGLAAYWPYCTVAKQMKSAVLSADESWDTLQWTRRFETFGQEDEPKLNTGAKGEVDGICQPGELTDRGRETTLALGQRIRMLYVEQLGFLPPEWDAQSASRVRLRATPIPRALESVQQAFTGLYPASTRPSGLPPPMVVTRSFQDETLFPNEGACKRFAELAHAFADRAAKVYNDGPELAYVNKKIGKYMPPNSPVVKVDSHPRLSGIMDTVNATLAHGKDTRLPADFYDKRVLEHIDRICVDEWYAGYHESSEYRKLGIGATIGDLTQRMVESATDQSLPRPGERPIKMGLAGCHDTTLAASLSALGVFDIDRDHWPRYTSSIAFELFQAKFSGSLSAADAPSGVVWPRPEKTWWSSLFSSLGRSSTPLPSRAPLAEWTETERQKLDGHYVRIRYNDTPLTLPFCRQPGHHFKDDPSFCTLAAFKEAADRVTPRNWKQECGMNLGQPAMPTVPERPPGL